jgi:hypothetical protein
MQDGVITADRGIMTEKLIPDEQEKKETAGGVELNSANAAINEHASYEI